MRAHTTSARRNVGDRIPGRRGAARHLRHASLLVLTLLLALAVGCTGGSDDGGSDNGNSDAPGATTASDGGGSVAVAPDDREDGAGSGDSSNSSAPANTESSQQLIAALQRTQVAESYRFEMQMTMEGLPDQPLDISFDAEGAFDPAGKRSQLRLDMSSLFDALAADGSAEQADLELMQSLLGDGVMEVITDGDTVYMRWALFSMLFGAPTEWISITDAGGNEEFLDSFGAGASDPSQMLAELEAFGSVTEIGRETVRGVETTRYTALMDLRKLMEASAVDGAASLPPELALADLPEVPFDVWVDDDGLVRRVEWFMRLSDFEAGAPGSMLFSMDYFGFGDAVNIELPASEDVTELDEAFFSDSLELLGAGA